MLVRIMGKGRKCRYSLLSEKLLKELREYFKEYRPQKWLFEGETPGEPYSASALVKILKEAATHAGISTGYMYTCCAIRLRPTCWSKGQT